MTVREFDGPRRLVNELNSHGRWLRISEQVLDDPDMPALSVLLAIDRAAAPCSTARYLAEFRMTRADIDTVPWLPAIPPLKVL
ncbi:hypothetical protein [Mycobacteroides abscessus]|uniref:hypothetical protein n=1 Tax=Mycobacteroides abscessus TaxID=36809 RepID=UPI0009A7FC31|nr:hypothetical protein [Mycobacteroides abscessus]SKG31552.1 Uncharacterised protein [Mycobacteroides abscessus subsp. bolletii]SKG40858.1 Uncharacterised protein [Mycobacteroides abscessus subsp. bolletii]SKG65841.1 Uncharacterised protein [Mycobacteroides abscessus subsp. bolletii]SKH67209.1 Uncharacterised protein [Mycobacteroides abscessus subsp. bolletii]SKH67295.1 Uncharacterised protein [Mycobacteroides abscessus subsp. bolletii]